MVKKLKPRLTSQRNQSITLGFEQESPTIERIEGNADGSMSFFGPANSLLQARGATESFYWRKGRRKVSVRIPDGGASIGSLMTALSRYDRIFGVDTNCICNDDGCLCVSALVEMRNLRDVGGIQTAEVERLYGLEFHPTVRPPRTERVGWMLALRRLEHYGWIYPSSRVLLVVDCDLGLHEALNARSMPIWGDYMLPSGVTIGYASADSSTASVVNGLMATCDSTASQVMKHVRRGPREGWPPLMLDPEVGLFRFWIPQVRAGS